MTLRRVALAQINTIVGDFEHNRDRILETAEQARRAGAHIVCYPELAVCGYPPLDLLERPSFVERNREVLREIADTVNSVDLLVGYAGFNPEGKGKPVHNSAALIREGTIVSRHHKRLLPTYDVFNEARYFEPGPPHDRAAHPDAPAVSICEDIWNDPEFTAQYDQPRYRENPLEELTDGDPGILFNLSASPYVRGKDRFRTEMIQRLAEKYGITIVMCNLVGGNDSLIFDGNSLVVDANGDVLGKGESFKEDLVIVDRAEDDPVSVSFPSEEEGVYRALKRGLSDYMDKCGFERALLGLSGGIDSSLTATLAVDVLGPENVLGILMPSEITSDRSVTDAKQLAENLGIETRTFPIAGLFDEYLDVLSEEFAGLEWDATEENLQARIRGNLLMALSNKYGHMVLSTGNKSELAVGYCTLYGDMSGGLAVISDVPKTLVYRLAEYRNREGTVIPPSVIDKPPSAELAPDQVDEDELPPYEVLDQIMELYVSRKLSQREIIEQGFEAEVVEEIVRLIDRNEYKRQQAAPGLKVTSKTFGTGRNMPIAQHFDAE